jgi:exonuclease III
LFSFKGKTVWILLDTPRGKLLIGGVYCHWTDKQEGKELAKEGEHLTNLLAQVQAEAESTKHVVVLGDFNHDRHRMGEHKYYRGSSLNVSCWVLGRGGVWN